MVLLVLSIVFLKNLLDLLVDVMNLINESGGCSSSWRTERRGRAQDQDRGTVANLRNHCKLICIDANKKDTFPVLKYINLIYVI
jgi:hypothetical protein